MFSLHARVFLALSKFAMIVALFGAGLYLYPYNSSTPFAWLYWAGLSLLTLALSMGRPLRRLISRWNFQSRIRTALPEGPAPDVSRLSNAALAIHQNNPERALFLLQNLSEATAEPAVRETHRWLTALAAVRWLSMQKPGRPLSGLYANYPQLHALMFSFDPARIPMRQDNVKREVESIPAAALDGMAQQYISLIDVLVDSVDNSSAPYCGIAEEMLTFMTGRTHFIGSRDRLKDWWSQRRVVLAHGGGALLACMRLMRREAYREAVVLLERMREEGLLSGPAETLRRAALFLELFAHPQWRMTGSDMPRYFHDGCYYLAVDMGVLRFPTAELDQVIDCCRHGAALRRNKRELVEESLLLWEMLGDEVGETVALLLKRLLEVRGRQGPNRIGYWQDEWKRQAEDFEKPIELLMEGVVATARNDLARAESLFQQAAALETQTCTARVNLVHVKLLQKKKEEAQALVTAILSEFSRDGNAMIALGRLFAMHLEDTRLAEELFLRALELTDPPTEALLCLGDIKLMQGQYLESHNYFDYARQLEPTLPDPKLGLARIYLETRRYDLAMEHLQPVIDSGPPEARDLACYLMYRACREAGQDRRAVEYLDRIALPFFKEPDLLDEIAVHLESEKMYAKARVFSERAMLLRAGQNDGDDGGDTLSAI